jgi:hypothetical protein
VGKEKGMEMKKISVLMRRRMLLDLEEKGLSDKELKEKYGIADNRTLRKHLGLAEKEREVREARIRILADNLAQHLAEIRNIVEQWRNSLETPWFGTISFETDPRPTRDLEQNLLFVSLREHLPFPTLWRDYLTWANKVESYIDACKKFLEETRQEAKNSPDPEIKKIADDIGTASTARAVSLTKPLADVVVGYRAKAELQLTTLSDEINTLRDKLVGYLEEILLKRDYIVYTCRLCPGQARLLR